MKTCSCCKVKKPLTEFHKDKTKKSGFDYRCKSCISEKSRMYYIKNAESLRKKSSEFRRSEPDKYRVLKRKWEKTYRGYEKNRLRHIEYTKLHYKKNRKLCLERGDMHTSLLTDRYICAQLHISISKATPELIEAKRSHMKIRRKLKELKA